MQLTDHKEENSDPNGLLSGSLSSLLSGVQGGVALASANPSLPRLASGDAALDTFFSGGLPIGAVTEWGMPLGGGGREVLFPWLAQIRPQVNSHSGFKSMGAWALWIHSHEHLKIYPPAWQARGLKLECLRFACTAKPLVDLKAVFLEPLFRFIVIDTPHNLSDDDCFFLARQARRQQQIICILRDAFLTPGRGSVWAKQRINVKRVAGTIQLQALRGLPPQPLSWIS